MSTKPGAIQFILATCTAVARLWGPNAYAALGMLISAILVQTFTLARAQAAINLLDNDPQGRANNLFTTANWRWGASGCWLAMAFIC